MAASFPTSLPTIQRVAATDRRNAPGKEGHALHNRLAEEVEALAAAVGVAGSAVAGTVEARLAAIPADTDAAIAEAITTNGLLGYVPQAGGNSGRYIMSPYDGAEASLYNVLIETTSSDPYSSHIGTATAKPLGVSGTNSDPAAGVDAISGTPWSVDAGYVADSAGVSTVIGGYDHINNQLAGTIIGGGHNYLQYNVNGHGSILGGANNRIDGGRSTIIGGSSCTINGGANIGVIVGGEYNTCQGSRSVILGGLSNQVISTATYSAVVGGRSNTINAGVDYGVIISGQGNLVTHDYAVVMGNNGISDAVGALTISRTKLSKDGDCQTTIHEFGIRTTNATIANMTQYFTLVSADKAALAIRAQIVAIDEATGDLAVYVWDGGMTWDGTSTATFYDAGGSGASRNFTQIVDSIGCAAVPVWSGTTAAVRPKVTGKLSTNIKWSCTALFTVTRL